MKITATIILTGEREAIDQAIAELNSSIQYDKIDVVVSDHPAIVNRYHRAKHILKTGGGDKP